MIASHAGLIGEALFSSTALALGFWQLWSLSREQKRDRAKREERERD